MRLTEILMHIGTLIDYTSVIFFQIKGIEPKSYKKEHGIIFVPLDRTSLNLG